MKKSLTATVLFCLVFVAMVAPILALTSQARQFLILAQDSMSRGQFPKAEGFLARALQHDPNDPELLSFSRQLEKLRDTEKTKLLRAAEFAFNNKDPQALELFQKVIQIDPACLEAQQRIIEIKAIRQKIQSYQAHGFHVSHDSGRAFDLQAYSAVAMLAGARKAFEEGNLPRARELLLQILQREPHYGAANRLFKEIQEQEKLQQDLATLWQVAQSGNFVLVREKLPALLEKFPKEPKLWILSGKAALEHRQGARALVDFERALELGAPVAELFPLLADAYACHGRLEQAYALERASNDQNFPTSTMRSFRFYFRAYPFSAVLAACMLVLAVIALIWFLRQLDALLAIIAFKTLWRMQSALRTSMRYGALHAAEDIALIAKSTGLPWFRYLFGLLLLRATQTESAIVELRECLGSPTLAPGAYFFLALAQRHENPALAASNLEQALIRLLDCPKTTWRPKFLRELELELLQPFLQVASKPLLQAVLPIMHAYLSPRNLEGTT